MEHGHDDNLILDFYPLELRDSFYYSKSFSYFDTAALETSEISEGCIRSATETGALRGRHLVTP